jgi:CheY-like chemotaxis protein
VSKNTNSPVRKLAGQPLPRPPNPPRRILVVEDNDDIRALNTEVLLQFGYHVDTATDGANAWDALKSHDYQLVVTDNEMPNVTGVELLKLLYSARMALPVVMATGALPKDDFRHCPWLLPAALLLKPYTLLELVRTVQGVLRVTDGVGAQFAPASWQREVSSDAWKS